MPQTHTQEVWVIKLNHPCLWLLTQYGFFFIIYCKQSLDGEPLERAGAAGNPFPPEQQCSPKPFKHYLCIYQPPNAPVSQTCVQTRCIQFITLYGFTFSGLISELVVFKKSFPEETVFSPMLEAKLGFIVLFWWMYCWGREDRVRNEY